MICPKCGSNNVHTQTFTETNVKSKGKGFGCIKACIGYLLFNIPGILCGLCGMGKEKTRTTTYTRNVNQCQNCGKRF
jgi:hypothetical protein